jgi:hypothetical protein
MHSPQTTLDLREWARIVESLGRIVLTLGALLYALGFLVFTLHMASWGYFWLDLLDRRYFLAGGWATLPIGLYFVYSQVNARYLAPDGVSRTKTAAALVKMAQWFTVIGASFLIGNALRSIGVGLTWAWMAMIFGSGFTLVLVRALGTKRPVPTPGHADGALQRFFRSLDVFQVTLTLSYVTIFSYVLFPTIPQYLGGGASSRVSLVPRPEARSVLTASGVAIDSTGKSLDLTLLSLTATSFVVTPDSTEVVSVERSIVAAFIVKRPSNRPKSQASRREIVDTTHSSGLPDTAHGKTVSPILPKAGPR